MTTPLHPGRLQVLLLMEVAEREGRRMRISNETNTACAHWRPATWLIANGLAEETRQPNGEFLVLTAAGRDVIATHHTTTQKD